MIHTNPLIFEIVAPVVAIVLYGRIKVSRRRARLIAEGHAEPEFASAESPKPRTIVRLGLRIFPHHNAAEEGYLRAQLGQILPHFFLGLYVTLAITTNGIYYDPLHILTTDHPSGPLLWANFLYGWKLSSIPLTTFAIFAGCILPTQLVGTSLARFYRSRPISLNYIFWTRSVLATTTFLATLVMGFALSFALFVAVRGPAWSKPDPIVQTNTATRIVTRLKTPPHPVPSAPSARVHAVPAPRVVNLGTAKPGLTGPYRALFFPAVFAYFTSPFRLALSNILSALAFFACMAMLGTLPFRMRLSQPIVSGLTWSIVVLVITVSQIHQPQITKYVSRFLFLYPQLGAPPSYIFALVPVAFIVLFSVIARFCFTYREE